MERYTGCVGLPPRTVVTFSDAREDDNLILKSLFQQEVLEYMELTDDFGFSKLSVVHSMVGQTLEEAGFSPVHTKNGAAVIAIKRQSCSLPLLCWTMSRPKLNR